MNGLVIPNLYIKKKKNQRRQFAIFFSTEEFYQYLSYILEKEKKNENQS